MQVEILNNNKNVATSGTGKATKTGSLFAIRIQSGSDSFSKKDSNDPSKDGKFSFGEAAKNFFKGLVSPITGMFSSTKNFLINSAAILGTAGLCVIGLGPAVIAFWTGYGLIQGASSLHKIITNKDNDEKEKAFFDLGEATFMVGTSVLCAKSSLKDTGLDTSGMSPLKATVECFKNAPGSISKSFTNLKAIKSHSLFVKKTFNQIDASSLTDAYGQVAPVRSTGLTKSGMGINLKDWEN